MHYVSTRGRAPVLTFDEAMRAGLARDGGLYVPERVPTLSSAEIAALAGQPYEDIAFRVMQPFLGDSFGDAEFRGLIAAAYAGFGHAARAPLVQLGSNHVLLELFHGPTLAFKDFAMQLIGKLFQAALIPGLMAALFYCLTIAIVVRRQPHLAPLAEPVVVQRAPQPLWPRLLAGGLAALVAVQWARGGVDGGMALAGLGLAVLVALVEVAVMPAILLALVVVGGIYGGVFTPTEGAAVGAVAMLLIGLGQRSLSFADIVAALRQTAETSGMIFIILLGAEVFGAFLALSRLPTIAAETIGTSGLSPYMVLIAMLAFYILLGAVMDELAMILLTLPVFFPVIQGLDFGMPPDELAIWFGILVLTVVGIGLTAPPIGLNVFVISAIARNVPITATYRGVLPFIVADIIRLVLVLAMPGLALWLVRWLA
jgi:TRAP-type C4-dicarboxylate transport system permease large subunit